jgi:hypothetical protein
MKQLFNSNQTMMIENQVAFDFKSTSDSLHVRFYLNDQDGIMV